MDPASAAELREFLSNSNTRMERQEEQMMATGCAVQALVAQFSELTTQLQQLKVETASTQQPLTSDPPAPVDQTARSAEPRLPPPALYSGKPQLCRSFLAKEAARLLAELRQGNRTVTDYSIEFRTLAAECGWNSEAQWDMFLYGLSDFIKDEIYSLELPTGVDSLIDLAIWVDTRLQSETVLSLPDPEPMQMGRSRLSQQEKQRRRERGLCLYCGATGHIAAQCPVKASTCQFKLHSLAYDCEALVDSGAEGNCLDINLAQNLKIPKNEHMDLSNVSCEYLDLKGVFSNSQDHPSFLFPGWCRFLFVKKKDGSLRPCIDYRGLNGITVKNTYPLLLMSSAFERLQGASFFTKLDLRNAYHLVRIREGDEWKTAFNTPRGHFEYLVLLFGLSNAPAIFQALVNNVLRDMVDQFIYVYLDDILIFSRSLQEHVQHVRQVLQRLLENGLYVKAEKCVFHAQSVPFLGYIVSAEGVRMDSNKVQAVVNWPTPDSCKALQRFLGFVNFYRWFIRNFSQLAAPLTALTSTKTPFRWSSTADTAFAKLKGCFVSAPILVAPDPSRQVVVEVDASEVGVGAVLSQRSSADGKMHPCVYFSHHLSPAERNYDIGNRDLLAVKLALEEWRHWLEDFSISYRPGSKNIKPDALSRIFDHSERPSFPESIVPQKVRTASQGVTPPPGCLPGRLFVPECLRSEVIRWGHYSKVACHPGVNRTTFLVKRDETVLVAIYGSRHSPFCFGLLDFVSGLLPSQGNTVVLTVVDRFSKATHFIPLPKLPSAR
ncbi:Transposon Tf2-9 polyprotein [Labeo rohita]|uniref:ribonuclease H n=1 Tax=Labeo rohita TaxID=84645 RepID=A0ABQ8L4F9_LABRO|nr:Transposon Tf2-9 polyprotein [Labeo rohita]